MDGGCRVYDDVLVVAVTSDRSMLTSTLVISGTLTIVGLIREKSDDDVLPLTALGGDKGSIVVFFKKDGLLG
jgi:hypothetical protein